jgi:hypothetical protein
VHDGSDYVKVTHFLVLSCLLKSVILWEGRKFVAGMNSRTCLVSPYTFFIGTWFRWQLEPFLGGKWRRKPVFLLRNVRLWRKYSCQIRQPSGKQGTEKTGRGKQQESGAEVTETMSQSDTVETDSSPGKQHDCKAKSR